MSEKEVELAVETAILERANENMDFELGDVDTVDCEEIKKKAGAIADCEVTWGDGSTKKARMKMEDDEGHWRLEFE